MKSNNSRGKQLGKKLAALSLVLALNMTACVVSAGFAVGAEGDISTAASTTTQQATATGTLTATELPTALTGSTIATLITECDKSTATQNVYIPTEILSPNGLKYEYTPTSGTKQTTEIAASTDTYTETITKNSDVSYTITLDKAPSGDEKGVRFAFNVDNSFDSYYPVRVSYTEYTKTGDTETAAVDAVSDKTLKVARDGYTLYTDKNSTTGEEYEYALSTDKDDPTKHYAEIVGYTAPTATKSADTAVKLTVPGTVTKDSIEYTVNAIDKEAFAREKYISSVTIPASIKSIASKAFCDCSHLDAVTYEGTEALAVIAEDDAFFNTPFAYDVEILSMPTTARDKTTIDSEAANITDKRFKGMKLTVKPWDENAKTVTVPEDCTVSKDAAGYMLSFEDTSDNVYYIYIIYTATTDTDGIDSYNVEATMCYNGEDGGENDYWLSDYGTPDSKSGNYIFSDEKVLPHSRYEIESDDDYIYYIDTVNDKAYIKKYIGSGTSVTVPTTYGTKKIPITTILSSAFEDNDTITSVVLNSTNSKIEFINDKAFADCDSLTSVELPDTLRYIGKEAFNSGSIETLTVPNYVSKIAVGDKQSDNTYAGKAFSDKTKVKSADGSAAQTYCENENYYTSPNFVETTDAAVIKVPVEYTGVDKGSEVTLTVKNGDTEVCTVTAPAAKETGSCGADLYIDSSKLNATGSFKLEITRDGYTKCTVTGYNTSKAVPSDIEIYAGELSGDTDGNIDIADVAEIVKCYGKTSDDTAYNKEADFDENGEIDLTDVGTLIANYLKKNTTKEATTK